jgi:hypothetical protein
VIDFDFNPDDITVMITFDLGLWFLVLDIVCYTVLLYEYKLCRHILLLYFFTLIYLALSISPSYHIVYPHSSTQSLLLLYHI